MESDNRWAELHPYVLDEIVTHVDSFGDYVRFRAACKSWSLHMPRNPAHIKNPWLVLPFEDEDETLRPFLNMGENKIYRFELPETRNTMFRGSYYGWLVAIGINNTLQILNPFTREQFDLPPLSTFPDVKSYEPDRLGREYTILRLHDDREYTCDKSPMQKSHAVKIVISSPPNNNDDTGFMAVTIYGEYMRLAYCKIGDNRWTDIPTTEPWNEYEDVIFHEGKLYAVNWKAQLYEYDMKTMLGGISQVQPPPNLDLGHNSIDNLKYLVATPDSLLMIVRRRKSKCVIYNGERIFKGYITLGFEIYKLKSGEWSLVNCLGNFIILLGHNSSFCTLPETFPNSKGNRIYFTDDNIDALYNNDYGGHDIGYFDLADGSFNHLFPDTDYVKPYPIWLLHKLP